MFPAPHREVRAAEISDRIELKNVADTVCITATHKTLLELRREANYKSEKPATAETARI